MSAATPSLVTSDRKPKFGTQYQQALNRVKRPQQALRVARPQAAMGGGVDTAGGFLVEDEVTAAVYRQLQQVGVMRRFAYQVPMNTDTAKQAVIHDPTAAEISEGNLLSETDATLSQASLIAKKFCCRLLVSTELREDAVSGFEQSLVDSAASALAYAEDNYAFNDATDGLGTKVTQTVVGIGATLDDWIAMISATKHLATTERPRWYMAAPTYAVALTLAGAAGTQALPGSGDDGYFLGAPVTLVPSLPVAGGASGAAIAFYGYLGGVAAFGDRSVSARWLSELAAANDQFTLISISRVAFDVHDADGALTSLSLA